MKNQLLTLPEVAAKIGKTCPALRGMVNTGKFPKPIKTGTKSIAWLDRTVDEWIAERMQASGYSTSEVAAVLEE